jgi:hypothetical protein
VLEVRAVDQDTGEPLVLERLVATATPGQPVTYSWTPTNIWYTPGLTFDYSTNLELIAKDEFGNKVPIPQDQALSEIKFQGTASGMSAPSCTVEGTVVTCPSPRYNGSGMWYNGYFELKFTTSNPMSPTVRIDQV